MMMKKLMMTFAAMMMAASMNAQYLNDSGTPFEQDKMYVAASMSAVSFLSQNNGDYKSFEIGAGARYYFDKVGIFLGAMAKYAHQTALGSKVNDFQPEIQAGYAFFLGRHVTIEPELYYKHSFKDSDYSSFGLRVGAGFYF